MDAATEIRGYSGRLTGSDPRDQIDNLVGADEGEGMGPDEISKEELDEFVAFVRHHCPSGPGKAGDAVIVSFSADWNPFFPKSAGRNRPMRRGETFATPKLLERVQEAWRTHPSSTGVVFNGGRCFVESCGAWRKDASGQHYWLLHWKLVGGWPFRDPNRVIIGEPF